MNDIVIKIEKLSKTYKLGHQSQRQFNTMRDLIAEQAKQLARKIIHPLESSMYAGSAAVEEFLALKDVSLEISRGDSVGIIGRNGAGKSTLLKILSRITEPTQGRIEIEGRVASLLEVGTGFHSELTGRENIFLNGAVLGMTRTEIRQQFDEIVAFAEVEKFLDTPVKRYSSGMYVRLAFAVAAHLQPEILIVDEVLAVGDVSFQKKCLERMKQVSSDGKTVLFVSHHMGSISQLCNKVFLLDKGELVKSGEPGDVMDYYVNTLSSQPGVSVYRAEHRPQLIYFSEIAICNSAGQETSRFPHDEDIFARVECVANEPVQGSIMGFYVQDQSGRKVFTNNNDKWGSTDIASGKVTSHLKIPKNFLVPGRYSLTFIIWVAGRAILDEARDAVDLLIIDNGCSFASSASHEYGCVFANCTWDVSCKGATDS